MPDIVLVSHDHYDHLDVKVVVKLSKMNTVWVVPLGLRDWFVRQGVKSTQIIQLDVCCECHLIARIRAGKTSIFHFK